MVEGAAGIRWSEMPWIRQLFFGWGKRDCPSEERITWCQGRTWCAKKSHKHSGRITEAVYLEVTVKAENAKKAGRRVSVSGMLKYLGVSRSGYVPHGNGIYHPILPNAENCSRTRSKRFMTILIRIMVPLRSQRNCVKQGKTFLKELSANTWNKWASRPNGSVHGQ